MAVTLIQETGSGVTGANTYQTLAGANAYHDASVGGAAWAAKTEPERNVALAHATRILDTQFRFQGIRTHQDQPLAFPRAGITVDGVLVDSETVPAILLDAQSEIALALLTAGAFQIANPASGGADVIKSVSVGKGAVDVEYQDPAPGSQATNRDKTVVSPYVRKMLEPLALWLHGSSTRPVYRG
jgi:hypothetical protein